MIYIHIINTQEYTDIRITKYGGGTISQDKHTYKRNHLDFFFFFWRRQCNVPKYT